jgi:hypothetical protein
MFFTSVSSSVKVIVPLDRMSTLRPFSVHDQRL